MEAQDLTREQAIDLVERLQAVEILSEKGGAALKRYVKEDDFERDKRRNLVERSTPVSSKLSKAQILIFLSRAFLGDLYYRLGIVEQSEFLEEKQQDKGDQPLTGIDYAEFQTELDSVAENSAGARVEAAISDEENFPDEARNISLSGIPSLEDFGLINRSRSALGKTCTRTLQDLQLVGLINSTVFKEVKAKIDSYDLTLESAMVSYAAERVIFYEDFEENKKKERDFLKYLYKNGIIADGNLEMLLDTSSHKQLYEKYDLIQYSNNAKAFNLKELPSDLQSGYEEIFEGIRSFVPNFNYSNLLVSLLEGEEDYGDGLTENRLKISFNIDDEQYTNEVFHDFVRKETQDVDSILKVNSDFHQGVNKYLADTGSSYRLYYANNSKGGTSIYSDKEFGLIVLTEEQFKAWSTSNSDYFLFAQSHDNSFNSKNVKGAIQTYKQLGLFSHLTDEEVDRGEKCVANKTVSSYQDILSCFPSSIVFFDWETGNLENPYESLTQEIAQASRGHFEVTEVQDNFEDSWDEEKVNYSFKFKGQVYKRDLEMQGDWLDPSFLDLVMTVMKENNVGGELHYCIDDGQANGFIFLTDGQYKYLFEHQKSLFPDN